MKKSNNTHLFIQEMLELPEELQFLEPTKKRELDTNIRIMLVEVLVALGTTREGREMMRSRGVYPVLKHLNLQENDEQVLQLIVEDVNLICRDEILEKNDSAAKSEESLDR